MYPRWQGTLRTLCFSVDPSRRNSNDCNAPASNDSSGGCSLLSECRFDRVEQRAQGKRYVVDPPIDEERWGPANATLVATAHVLADALHINMVVELAGIACQVELQPLGIAAQLVKLQVRLVVEQKIVHRPELVLRTGSLRGFGRVQRVGMDSLEREMTVDEPDAAGEAFKQQLDRRRRLLAVRTLEISVLDHGDASVGGTDRVVGPAWRDGQFERVRAIHRRAREIMWRSGETRIASAADSF